MTISGFLPQRWRTSPEIARHAESIAGVLHTAPLEPGDGGPAIISLLGTADVLPYLVAIKSLSRRLRRGRISIVDDGTLTGEDRAILAHHCGDPEIRPFQAVARGAFPASGPWAQLLTILDRRAGQYWIALDPHSVTLSDVPEVAAAISSNRSFALHSGGEAIGGAARQAERPIAALCATRGWRYLPGCVGLAGFAAGGTGQTLAAAFLGELAALADDGQPEAHTAVNLLLANEIEPAELPRARYAVWQAKAKALPDACALVHFPVRHRFDGDGYATASARAIARLVG